MWNRNLAFSRELVSFLLRLLLNIDSRQCFYDGTKMSVFTRCCGWESSSLSMVLFSLTCLFDVEKLILLRIQSVWHSMSSQLITKSKVRREKIFTTDSNGILWFADEISREIVQILEPSEWWLNFSRILTWALDKYMNL